jgi:hypothetical protein
MAAINTWTDIDALINDVYEGAMMVAREQNLMSGLVRNFSGRGMFTRRSSIYGTVSFNEVAETDDVVAQALVRNPKGSLTPTEKAASYFISDQRIESDDQDIVADASRELGMGLADAVESSIITNFDDLTGGTIGAAGTVLHWGHILAAQTILRNAKAPLPYSTVIHPNQWHNLGRTMTIVQGAKQNAPDDLLSEVVDNFWVDTVYGVRFFVTSNVPVDSNADSIGAMFARDAIALDVRRAPRIERARDISRRGIEVVMTAIWATGVWRPEYGVTLVGDATTPTY